MGHVPCEFPEMKAFTSEKVRRQNMLGTLPSIHPSNQLLGLATPTDVRSLQSLQDRPKHGQNVGKPY